MRENTYVRVYGNIRSFNNQRGMTAFRITRVEDMNELTMHLLEVIHSHLCWQKASDNVSVVERLAGLALVLR